MLLVTLSHANKTKGRDAHLTGQMALTVYVIVQE